MLAGVTGVGPVLRRLPLLLVALLMLTGWTGRFVDDVSGEWHGTWRSSSEPGFFYAYAMTLRMNPDQSVVGEIRWTLLKSPRPQEQARIGREAVEYVRGSGNRRKRSISLFGYARDDPHVIIGLDRYELVLQPRAGHIAGVTYSHGTWKGRFVGEKRRSPDRDRARKDGSCIRLNANRGRRVARRPRSTVACLRLGASAGGTQPRRQPPPSW